MLNYVRAFLFIALAASTYIVFFWIMVQVSEALVGYALAFIAGFLVVFLFTVMIHYFRNKRDKWVN